VTDWASYSSAGNLAAAKTRQPIPAMVSAASSRVRLSLPVAGRLGPVVVVVL
jgi:hypothetical protein